MILFSAFGFPNVLHWSRNPMRLLLLISGIVAIFLSLHFAVVRIVGWERYKNGDGGDANEEVRVSVREQITRGLIYIGGISLIYTALYYALYSAVLVAVFCCFAMYRVTFAKWYSTPEFANTTPRDKAFVRLMSCLFVLGNIMVWAAVICIVHKLPVLA